MFNAKSYVRSLLMDSSIISLTGDDTVHYIHANSPTSPYVEYEFYDESGNAYAEGKEIATNFYLQVDIFSNKNFSDLEEKIKEKLISAGFNRTGGADMHEKDTQLYHKALRFNFTSNNQ